MTLGVVSALLPSLGQAEDLMAALGSEHPSPMFEALLADDRFTDLRPMFAAFSLPATETTMVITPVTDTGDLMWNAVHGRAEELAAEAGAVPDPVPGVAAWPRA